jgi:hypothetical protein
MYRKYTLNTKSTKKKTAIIVHVQIALHFALNIGGISAQSHMLLMLLFVIYFFS